MPSFWDWVFKLAYSYVIFPRMSRREKLFYLATMKNTDNDDPFIQMKLLILFEDKDPIVRSACIKWLHVHRPRYAKNVLIYMLTIDKHKTVRAAARKWFPEVKYGRN